MPRRDVLARAIGRAGSIAALARLLRVRPETVRRWQVSGVSAEGQKRLEALKAERAEGKRSELERRQIFDELFKLAGAGFTDPSGREKKLPKVKTHEGVRSGPMTSGYKWLKHVGKMLTYPLIRELDAWMTSKRKRFPVWQAVVTVSEYRKEKFTGGYKTVRAPLGGKAEAGDFAIEDQIPTPRSTSLAEVRDVIVGKLEAAIENSALVFVHGIALFNYRVRTEAERKAWESSERRKRWKKKNKKPRPSSKTSTSKSSSGASKKAAKKKPSKPVPKTRVKSASSRSPSSRSTSKPGKGKASRRTTSAKPSHSATSRKSLKKPLSSSTTKKTPGKKAKTKTKTKAKARTKR